IRDFIGAALEDFSAHAGNGKNSHERLRTFLNCCVVYIRPRPAPSSRNSTALNVWIDAAPLFRYFTKYRNRSEHWTESCSVLSGVLWRCSSQRVWARCCRGMAGMCPFISTPMAWPTDTPARHSVFL